MTDSPAAGNTASPEVAKRPAIIPGKFQDHAEAAWQAWYEPEYDIARFMVTSTYDQQRKAFAAGFEAGIKAERERLAAVLTPAKLRLLADWFDADDVLKRAQFPTLGRGQTDEVQRDLRRFADRLEDTDG